MKAIKTIGVWLKRCTTAVSMISFLCVILIMLLIVADVIVRKVLNSPISGAYEIVQYLLMSFIFASFAYTQSERGHIHITMLIRIMPQKLRFVCYSITGLLSTAVAAYLGYAAILQADQALVGNYISGVLRFQIYPFYWVMAITMFVFTIALFFDVIRSFIAMFNDDFANDIMKDWS